VTAARLNQARCEILACVLYGGDKSGRAASQPWRIAVLRTWRSVTISSWIVLRDGGLPVCGRLLFEWGVGFVARRHPVDAI